jgi:hypothetical protein
MKGKAGRRRSPGRGWRLAAGTGAGRARGFLRFWPLYERVMLAIFRPHPIPAAPYGLLLVRFTRYQGRPIALPDGTHVARGDLVGEVHIHNAVVPDLASDRGAFELLRMFRGDLRALAAWATRPDFPAEMRALYGLTILSRGGARLGFTLRSRPRTLVTRLDRFFMTGLLALYSPQGTQRLNRGTTYGDDPQEIWMSRGELLRRYGRHPTPGAEDHLAPDER